MASTLWVFLATYALLGFFLFAKGLALVESFPGVGGFLGDRIIYLIFFFFLIMLIVSAGVTNYIGLIKGTEVSWLLTLPISHRVLFLWKATEALLFASWSMFFLSAPLMLSFALSREAPWMFYPLSLFALVAFVLVAGAFGSALFLVLLRWANRAVVVAITILLAFAAVSYGLDFYTDTHDVRQRALGVVAVDQVLKHTEASVHPLSPSSWLSRTLVQWTRELRHDGTFYLGVLWSWALMGVLVLSGLGKHWFYAAWNRQQQREAFSAGRRRKRIRGLPMRWGRSSIVLPGLGRPLKAVIHKDLITFVREPSQWVQFVVVFGLLVVYVLNLRNLGYGVASARWVQIISYVNLAVCALAVSTLTTRFVFPQFSLEGSRLWVLGMAPLGLEKVVWQKWVQAALVIGLLSSALQVLSATMLELSRVELVIHAFLVLCFSGGLCAIAVGLGTLFPNLEETNSAKIVSGFGGTFCLICSFCYILAAVLTVALSPSLAWGVTGAVGWTLVFGGLPLALALRRAKRFEFLGPMG